MSTHQSRLQQEEQKWINAPRFTDLLELNKKYLEECRSGAGLSMPYWAFPVDEEAQSLIPCLLKLHERQIFTWTCEPYLHKVERENSGEYIECQQRPYLSFVVAEEDIPPKLFQELKKKKSIKVRALKLRSPDPMIRGSFTGLNLGRYRSSYYRFALCLRQWEASEIFNDNMADYSEEGVFTLEAMKQARPWVFDVVAASWKDINIPGIVLEAVEAVKTP